MKSTNVSTSSYYNNENITHSNINAINSHAFWVTIIVPKSSLVYLLCKLQNLTTGSDNMGGNRRRYEPSSCKEWKQKEEVWGILQHGGLSNFMERLHGRDGMITNLFYKKWKKGMLKMGDQMVEIDEDLIAQATGLTREGCNFYRDRKVSKEAIERYPETEKEKK